MMISNNGVKRLKKMPRGTFLAFFETHKWMHVCLLVAMVVTIPFMAFFSIRFLFLNVFPTLWSFYYPMATPTNLFLLLNLIIFTLFAMSHSPHSAAAPRSRSRPAARVLPSAAAMADDGDDDDDNDNPIHPSSPSPSPSPMSSIPYLHLPSSPSSNLMPTPSQSPSALAPSPSALASPAMQYYRRLFDHQVTDNYLNLMPTPSQSPSALAPSPSALASPAMQYYKRLFDHRVTDNYLVASPVRHLSFEDADMLLGSTGPPLPEASPPSSILASSSHKVMAFSTSTAIDNDDDDGGGGGGRRDGFDVDDATNLDKSGAYNSRKGKDLTQIVKKRAGSERQTADQQDEQGGAATGSDQISGAYYEGYNRESMESSEGRSSVVLGNGDEVDDAEEEEEEAEGGEVRHGSSVSHERPLASSHFTHRSTASSKLGAFGLGHSPLRPNNSRGRTNAKRPGQSLEATWRAICEAKKSTHPSGSPLKNNNRRIVLHRSTSGSPSSGNSPTTSLKAKPREPSMRADELHSRIEAFISRFNDQIRIQREQSILNYMEMVDRGAK